MYYYNNFYRPIAGDRGYGRNFAGNVNNTPQPAANASPTPPPPPVNKPNPPTPSQLAHAARMGRLYTRAKNHMQAISDAHTQEQQDLVKKQELADSITEKQQQREKNWGAWGRIRNWFTPVDAWKLGSHETAKARVARDSSALNWLSSDEYKKSFDDLKQKITDIENRDDPMEDRKWYNFLPDLFRTEEGKQLQQRKAVAAKKEKDIDQAIKDFGDLYLKKTGRVFSRPGIQTADAIRINFARKHAALTHAYVLGYTRNFASPGEQVAGAYVQPLTNSALLANNAITAGNTLLTGAGRIARDVLPVGGAIAGTIPGGMIGGMVGALAANALDSQDPLVDFLTLGGGTAGGLLTGGIIGNRVGQFLSNRYFPVAAPVPMVVPAQPVVAAR